MNDHLPRHHSRAYLFAAGCTATIVLLAACGQTRYVVVQSPVAAAPGAAPTVPVTVASVTTIPSTSTSTTATDDVDSTEPDVSISDNVVTTAPTTPPAVAGPASADDATAIQKAVEGALGLDLRSFDERSSFLTGADDLGPTYVAVTEVLKGISGSLRFGEITTDGDMALAIVDVIVNGADFAAGLPVELLRVDGEWKVTRSGACTVLTLASPCPDL